jgi:hypothetical protein
MSVRNNDERVPARTHVSDPPAAAIQPPAANSSTGLTFVVPTEFVELPSRGQFYSASHPLCDQESIEVRHMTAKEEDILTSRTLLKKGIAIDRLLQSIIVDKRIKVDDLLVGDKNAIIISTRRIAYGDEYSTKVSCPVCNTVGEHTFFLSEAGLTYPDDQEESFSKTEKGTFIVTLPKMEVDVEVRLLSGKDEKWLTKSMEQKRKHSLGETTLTDQMRLYIVSVSGITDKTQLNSFINVVPASDSRYLRNIYKKLSPNIDLTQDFSCSTCGADALMEVPFTADFFWPQ